MERHFIGLGILMFFLSTLPVYAGAPLDTVQTNANKVLDAVSYTHLTLPTKA